MWSDDVIVAGSAWLRTPWQHFARIKGAGVDCANLLCATYHEAGLAPEIRLERYPPDWMMHRSAERFLSVIEEHMVRVPRGGPGDAAVWKFGRCFSHGGIVVQWPRIIHAYRPLRMVVLGDALREAALASREVVFYRPRSIA